MLIQHKIIVIHQLQILWGQEQGNKSCPSKHAKTRLETWWELIGNLHIYSSWSPPPKYTEPNLQRINQRKGWKQWKWKAAERPLSIAHIPKSTLRTQPRCQLLCCRCRSIVETMHPTKAMMESDFSLSLSLEAWLVAWLCWCAFPRRLTWLQGCLLRWHWWSGCRKRSLRMWRTCGTWPRDPQGHVERVHYWWLPHCCCVLGLWVR